MILILLLIILFIIISYKKLGDFERSSSYECGFILCSRTRIIFSYRFFLISILFLIFDIEIVLILCIPFLRGVNSILIFMLFIIILIRGLIYEYYYGSLNWL